MEQLHWLLLYCLDIDAETRLNNKMGYAWEGTTTQIYCFARNMSKLKAVLAGKPFHVLFLVMEKCTSELLEKYSMNCKTL